MFRSSHSCARALAALALFVCLPAAAGTLPPLGSEAQQVVIPHVQRERLSARERAPQRMPDTLRELAHSDYDRPRDIAQRLQQERPAAARKAGMLAACDPNVFASASGSTLVSAVKSVDVTCLNQLY